MSLVTPPWVDKLARRFNRFTLRERSICAAAGVIILSFLMYTWAFVPSLKQHQRATQQIKATQVNLLKQQQENDRLHEKLQEDPNAVLTRRIAQYQTTLVDIEGEMEELTIGLISARRMPSVLRDALQSIEAIELLEFITLPPVELLPDKPKANLYQHGIRMRVEGKFIDVFRYLSRLEALTESFYWRRLDYSVQNYPLAWVEIEIYTLSINKEFIRGS